MESYMEMLANHAKHAAVAAAKLGTAEKNKGLCAVADELIMQQELILAENQKDLKAAEEKGVKQSLIDRLALSEKRIADMAEGLRQIASLDDPVGEILSMKVRPNGLRIGQKRVPLGVVGIIYESRPNVTADAFGLCFKTGNAVILRGGSDAIYSNQAIVRVIKAGLRKEKLCQDLVLLVEDTSREVVNEMMKMHGLIDVLIPRGGAGLIANVVANSTVPVIETGTGNCHVYVDETADIEAYDRNRNLLYRGLREAGFECVKPQGAFYMFVKSPEPDEKKFCEACKKEHILVVPGSSFACPGYVRISYCVSFDQISV